MLQADHLVSDMGRILYRADKQKEMQAGLSITDTSLLQPIPREYQNRSEKEFTHKMQARTTRIFTKYLENRTKPYT